MTGLLPSFRLAEGIDAADAPIRSRDELVRYFSAGESPRSHELVGIELERLPMRADGTAAPYEGSSASVTAVLEHLARANGVDAERLDGKPVGMRLPFGAVHLEPGAQVELALDPRTTARETFADLLTWRGLLEDARRDTGVALVAMGLQPITPVREMGWVPKERYRLMREHLGARGDLAHHMMKATAGVQFNLDFHDESDAASLVRAALSISPIVNALAANAPLENGRPHGTLTRRSEIWARTDPDRTGLLPWTHDRDGYSHARYVEWALHVPVMFVVRKGQWVSIGDRSFAAFLERGHPAAGRALHEDFALHLTTLFPEVRVKQHVEIRGQDSCSVEMNVALAALWRALMYDLPTRERVIEMLEPLSPRERQTLHVDASRVGLVARAAGRAVGDIAGDLIDLARTALGRLPGGTGDVPLLSPLADVLDSGRTAAEVLLEDFARRGPAALLARA